jgi:hypothetical protein
MIQCGLGYCIILFEFGIPMKLVRQIGKGSPVTGLEWPRVFQEVKARDVMTTAQDDGKVVSLTHRPPLPPQEMLLLLISVKRLSRPQGHSAI